MKQIPELLLERYALGECTVEERALVGEALKLDPRLSGRLEAITGSNRLFLQSHPATAAVPGIVRRSSTFRVGLPRPVWARIAMVAAGLLLVIVPSSLIFRPQERIKGEPGLSIYLKRDGEIVRLASGTEARNGDILQLAYRSAGRGYGVIASLDGRGVTTLHFPLSTNESTRLVRTGTAALSEGYRLDDAPSYEAFFFFSSGRTIPVGTVLGLLTSLKGKTAAELMAAPPVFDGCVTKAVVILKTKE